MMNKKHFGSICRALLTVALAFCTVFMITTKVKAADPIDWSQWENQSTEYMTQVVAEAHSSWGKGGLANWPTFDINTEDPEFGILKKGGEFEKLTEGVDYEIESIHRTIQMVSIECETFDKSKPGDYSFTLVGKGKYTGRVSVKFALNDTNPNSFTKIELTDNSDSEGRLKLGDTPKIYFKGKELVEGTDYRVIGLRREGEALTDFTDFSRIGFYTMTIEGMGKYSSGYSEVFWVYKPVGKVTLSATKFTYTGKYVAPTLTVKDPSGNKIPSTEYTVSGLKAKTIGKHTVTVTFQNDYLYNSVKTLTYTINPKQTSIKSVAKLSKGFKVTWAKSTKANATGYQIRYSTKSSMASAKSVKVKGYASYNTKVTGLKAKTKYYVQVRTYKTVSGKTYYSAWSAAKAITTK